MPNVVQSEQLLPTASWPASLLPVIAYVEAGVPSSVIAGG
jgi:hypothetical protein